MATSSGSTTRRGAVVIASTLAMAAALAAPPVVAATPGRAGSASGGVATTHTNAAPRTSRVVTLVTGDRISVSRLPGGRLAIRPLRGSPSIAEGYYRFSLSGHYYVVPRTLLSAHSRHFDLSRFDVTALMGGAASSSPPRSAPAFQMRTLTVRGTDVRGRRADFAFVIVANVDDGRLYGSADFLLNGSAKFSVPQGHYVVMGDFSGRSAEEIVVRPQVNVGADRRVKLDARTATARVRVGVPRPARTTDLTFTISRKAERFGSFSFGVGVSGGGYGLKVSPTHRVSIGTLSSSTAAHLEARGPGEPAYTYDVLYGSPRRIAADQSRTFSARDFATVHAAYYSDHPDRSSYRGTFRFLPHQFFDFESFYPLTRPQQRTEYYLGNPRVSWTAGLDAHLSFGRRFVDAFFTDSVRSYSGGQRLSQDWLRGPIHPGPAPWVAARSAKAARAACPACRYGDILSLDIAPFTDSQLGHSGDLTPVDTARWRLSRSGKKLASSGGYLSTQVKVRPDATAYKLSYAVSRSAPWWTQSTAATDHWTFHSEAGQRLVPLMFPRYRLPVDLLGRVAPGRMRWTLDLAHARGFRPANVRAAGVKVSFDGGATWSAARVVRRDANTFRVVTPNQTTGGARASATLKVSATDRAGNSVVEIVHDAYVVAGSANSSAPQTRTAQ